MNAGQYNDMMNVLGKILARMPERPDMTGDAAHARTPGHNPPFTVHHLDGTSTVSGPGYGPPPVPAGWPYDRPGPAPVASISRGLDGAVTKTMTPGNAGCGLVEGAHNHARCRMADTHAGNLGARQALGAVLRMLDGWIESVQDNHRGMEHRGENTGDECWRTFAPSDIRDMVNDVARELGLDLFPAPPHPQEDEAL